MRIINSVLLILTVASLAACGGGGSSNPALGTATVKLATSGTPSARLAGIGLTITMPDGVTPLLNADGSVVSSAVTLSSVAAPGTVLTPVYTAANGSSKATLKFALASSAPNGFGVGEFVIITGSVRAGIVPTQADFSLSGFDPVDVGGSIATGLTVAVVSVVVQ